MDVIGHDNKAIDDHPLVDHNESHTFHNYILIFLWFQQLFPFKDCRSKEMGILSYYVSHGCKTRGSVYWNAEQKNRYMQYKSHPDKVLFGSSVNCKVRWAVIKSGCWCDGGKQTLPF